MPHAAIITPDFDFLLRKAKRKIPLAPDYCEKLRLKVLTEYLSDEAVP